MISAAALDGRQHALIEASAGTGKTYAIEGIIAAVIRQRVARIDQVLVVTFTERAAATLRASRNFEGLPKSIDREVSRIK